MMTTNDHITRYLDHYLRSDFTPGFAVLLQGEWGCGKTWFIKNLIEKYREEQNEENGKKFLYLSLYSVRSSDEIEDQLFQQLHPVLSSKAMSLTAKALKGALRGGLKIDLNGEATALPDYLIKTDDCVLIFDDLERCKMPIEDTFGYVNSYVEHQGLKVIIIANEDELRNIEEKEQNKPNYIRIKEKLIGKTFKVSYDIESAFTSFVSEIGDADVKGFVTSHKDRIIEIFEMANFRNLRHLKQSLWDFERLYLDIPQKFRTIPELMHDLLSLFLAFSFEIKGGRITPPQIDDLESISVSKVIRNEGDEKYEPSAIEKAVDKYDFVNTYDVLLTEKCWRKLFDEGYLAGEEITESLEKSSYCQDEHTPDWVKLWHFHELEDDQFISLLDKVETQWKEGLFKQPGEILHVGGLFFAFSEIGLYSVNRQNFLDECKEYIRMIRKSGAWKGLGERDIGSLETHEWKALGNAAANLPEFQEMHRYLVTQLEESVIQGLPQAGKELLDVLVKDTAKFARMITVGYDRDPIFYEIPIFQHIDPEAFFDAFLTLKSTEKRTVAQAIEDRYKHQHIASKLVGEIKFLKAFDSLLEAEVAKRTGKVTGYQMTKIRDLRIVPALNQLEKLTGDQS